MSLAIRRAKVLTLAAAVVLAGCGDEMAQAQNRSGTQSQIREGLGDAPARIDTTTAVRLSAAFRGAAERALPAVVHVRVTTEATASNQRRVIPRGFPFPLPFDDDPQPRGGVGSGSGFVFDQRGYILTNHHVVANATRVLVTFVDGREYTATVVGSDPQTDVAVIKIEAQNGQQLNPVVFGSSDQLHVGDWVIALGNPLNLQFTVTAGIVSAKGRNLGILNTGEQAGTGLESFIQTDAAINPGNSGGPLIDLTGRVVGINSAIESPTGYWAGAGFAIPIDLARKVANDLITYGHVRRPRLGVEVGSVNAADAEVFRLPEVAGAKITAVQPDLPADRAGIQMGDVVVALNGQPIRTQTQFMEDLARLQPGQRVRLGIIRYGQRIEKTVELGEFETGETRRTARPARPRSEELLGFSVVPLTPQLARQIQTDLNSGVVVQSVDRLSPAVTVLGAGEGVIIRRINGREINSVADVERLAESLRPGQTVSLVVRFPGRNYDSIVNYRVR